MERKTFNPQDWLNQPTPQLKVTEQQTFNTDSQSDEVERIIQSIEANRTDITSTYSDWVIFYLAKDAGIDIAPPRTEKQDQEPEEMPTLPDSLFPELPEFLQKVVAVATSNEERDILLLGSLGAISACLPKVSGIYDGKRVFPNLFLFITAQASAGKGRLVHCRQLVNPIHKELREQAKLHKQHYELEMAEYNSKKGKEDGIEKPAKPPEKMLFIPANNSSTGAYQLLGDSDGRGLIFETEGDTLAHAFKSDKDK